MQRSMKTRTLKTVKAALSCFMSASLVLYMPVMAYAGEYDIQYGDITITATDDSHTVDYSDNEGAKSATDPSPTVTGTSNTNTVTLDSSNGDVNVTFSNLHITSSNEAAVNATGTHDVTIELNGSNSLQSGISHAGMEDNLNGTLTIKDDNNNGSLTATGGSGGAGIGGGRYGAGSNIMISGGTVTALGGTYGAGIGGAESGAGSGIMISGGNVTATGGVTGAGIGGGYNAAGSDITISGGDVTATGGNSGAGIGGGNSGAGSGITISGGDVTATGGNSGAGIGGGSIGAGSDITISGGTVIANSGAWGAGIGGGQNGAGSGITISGPANVSVAGGAGNDTYGSGAAIGNGGSSNNVNGAEAELNTTNLYTTGSITKYEPGTTAVLITGGTVQPTGEPIVGIVEPPVNPGPANPNSITANTIQAAENSPRTDDATTTTSTATEQETDAAYNTAVDMQVDDLLRQLYSLLEAGRLDEANALISNGLVINAGTHKGFDRATLEKLGELSRAGVTVTINFTYAGVNYSVTIPSKSEIDPTSLVDENGYCGFLNLMKYFG